jgi:recombinational DNA repair protein (RecF pathway)
MRNFKTEGIVIKRRNYKDADRILTVLTKTHGKIYVRAAGVRKITSRRAGHIEPLNHAVLTLYQGHAYPLLTEVSAINNFSEVKENLDTVGHALHLCELVDVLCPENQENTKIFQLLQQALYRLSQSVILSEAKNPGDPSASPQDDMGKLISEFEIQLLTHLGYWNNVNFAQTFDAENFIENIIERKLKARSIFSKLQ